MRRGTLGFWADDDPDFLSAAEGQRPRNYLSWCCSCFSTHLSLPTYTYLHVSTNLPTSTYQHLPTNTYLPTPTYQHLPTNIYLPI